MELFTTSFKLTKDCKKELKFLAADKDETMGELIQKLLDFYKHHKEVANNEGLQTTCEDAGTPVGE